MSKVVPLSGFPEWSQRDRIVERHVIDTLRGVFELHAFGEIETRAVEPLERLAGSSEASKEVYALRRVNADADDAGSGLGLHFDLTVPFARYVAENAAQLQFPFRRYQVQKVWRGERPQAGRFREFYQADIDVVGRDALPEHIEVEVAVVMARGLAALPIPAVTMHVNNRQLVEGFYLGVGVTDVPGALRSVDKLDKIGPEGVERELTGQGVVPSAIAAILEFAKITSADAGFAAAVKDLWETTPLIDDVAEAQALVERGTASLVALVEGVNAAVLGVAVADLRIARGLDYYTGAVYETFLNGHEDLGSICSGGRYDNLVAIKGGQYPGVGMSIGVSRLVSRILDAGLAEPSRSVPTAVLVAVTDEEQRASSAAIADRLRARGVPAEVMPSAAKFGKQIQYADKRGIPFVWFPADDGDGEVKDIRSGEQAAADADAWLPPEADRTVRVSIPELSTEN